MTETGYLFIHLLIHIFDLGGGHGTMQVVHKHRWCYYGNSQLKYVHCALKASSE